MFSSLNTYHLDQQEDLTLPMSWWKVSLCTQLSVISHSDSFRCNLQILWGYLCTWLLSFVAVCNKWKFKLLQQCYQYFSQSSRHFILAGIWPFLCNSLIFLFFFSLQTSSQARHCSGLELGPWHSSLSSEKENCSQLLSGPSKHFQMDGG